MAEWRNVVVESAGQVAQGVVDLHLVACDANKLSPAAAGAHVDVRLSNGLIRQYSIHHYDEETGSYHLGLGLAEPSRGGSAFIHNELKTGHTLKVSLPRNHFALDETATGFVFIAGGIGITPILSMIRWCRTHGRPWRMLYCVRSQTRAAYLADLTESDRVLLHADDEQQGRPDLLSFIALAGKGEHLYCCGPGPLMDAVEALAGESMPSRQVHFERFSAPASSKIPNATQVDKSFRVKLALSDLELTVPPDSSVLDVLEAAGVMAPFSCREGMCRTCECTVLDGEVDHRDFVLSDQERASNKAMLPCVSPASSSMLVLDL